MASFVAHVVGDKHSETAIFGSLASCALLWIVGGCEGKYCYSLTQQRESEVPNTVDLQV